MADSRMTVELRRRIRAIAEQNPDMNHTDIARVAGCHRTTVTRELRGGNKPIPGDADSAPVAVPEIDPVEAMRRSLERRGLKRSGDRLTWWELVGQEVVAAIERIEYKEPPKPRPLSAKKRFDPEEIVLLWSDSQIGQYVDARESGGLGSYSTPIFHERLEFLKKSIRNIAEIHVANTPCPAFNIFFLGDIVEGSGIFKGQQRQVDQHAIQQVICAVDAISEFVAWVAALYPWQVNCYGVVGNHGRIGDKGEESPLNNFDYAVYHFVSEKLKNYPNVTITAAESWYMLVEKMGWVFLLNHGDDIKAWAGIPFYGIQRSAARWRNMLHDYKSGYNYICIGHHHQEAEILSHMFINGQWPGGTEFSIKTMQSANAPTQTMFGVHKDYGVTWKRNIQLIDHKSKAEQSIMVYK